MPIDECEHTFEELAATVLPAHYARLENALESPYDASMFVGPKSVTRALLKATGRSTDFPGCYVFVADSKPVYVGISRGVLKRLVQHLNYDSHYSASLVYRIACDACPHEMKRDQAMKDEQFKREFFLAQGRLRQMKVACIEVDNDLELYLLEVLAAMRLNTGTWNTFRTH